MTARRRYRRRPDRPVTAVRLDLDTEGLRYRKWGAEQRAKPGDWLVNNDGDTYTVDAESFARSYRQVAPGQYVKTSPVWAEVAREAGSIRTREGESHYQAGDYLVFNDPDGEDGYCMPAARFEALYEPDD